MTVDVISELSFGKSLDMLRKPDNRWITKSISSYIRRSFMAMQYPAIFTRGGSSWLSADTWLFPTLLKDRARYLKATINVVQQRIDANNAMKERKDIMSYLLAAKDPESGENLELAEVWSEAYLMISAGQEDSPTKAGQAESMTQVETQPRLLFPRRSSTSLAIMKLIKESPTKFELPSPASIPSSKALR